MEEQGGQASVALNDRSNQIVGGRRSEQWLSGELIEDEFGRLLGQRWVA
nr:hypothetical protein [uncultured Rhodopila sp.]